MIFREYGFFDRSECLPQKVKQVCGTVIESVDSDYTCSICTCHDSAYKVIQLSKCDHQFHTDCINKWIKFVQICPMCRTPVDVKAVIPT